MILEKNPHHTEINDIKIEDVTYSSSSEISNVLNHHFTRAGPRLANDIPAIDTSFREYITPTQHTFSIYEMDSNDVYEIIQSLNSNKGNGLDGISCKLLKEAAPVITPLLTFIITLSIKSYIFPDDWKIAKVTPVFKEGSKFHPNSYRLYNYLTKHNLPADSQHGFRPMH